MLTFGASTATSPFFGSSSTCRQLGHHVNVSPSLHIWLEPILVCWSWRTGLLKARLSPTVPLGWPLIVGESSSERSGHLHFFFRGTFSKTLQSLEDLEEFKVISRCKASLFMSTSFSSFSSWPSDSSVLWSVKTLKKATGWTNIDMSKHMSCEILWACGQERQTIKHYSWFKRNVPSTGVDVFPKGVGKTNETIGHHTEHESLRRFILFLFLFYLSSWRDRDKPNLSGQEGTSGLGLKRIAYNLGFLIG